MDPQSSPGNGMSNELVADAKQMGSSAIDRAHSEVDARKGAAATQAKSVSSAINRAAGELDDGAPAWLKSAFEKGAEQIQRLAETIEQKDSRQLVDEVNGFARRSPGTFLLGCAAAGFAAARVLKAGGDAGASPGDKGMGSTSGNAASGLAGTSPSAPVTPAFDTPYSTGVGSTPRSTMPGEIA